MHCMTVSLAARVARGSEPCGGEERALAMLADAGFEPVSVHRIEGDIQNNYYVAHPAA